MDSENHVAAERGDDISTAIFRKNTLSGILFWRCDYVVEIVLAIVAPRVVKASSLEFGI